MIDQSTHDPGCQKLVKDNAEGGFPAVEFPVHGGDGSGAGNVQQTEYHQCICIAAPNPIVANVAAIVFIP